MIDAVGGAPTWAPQSAGANSWLQNVLKPVADKLGTDTSSLFQQLQGGASLSQIADQKGVSRSDLVAAIEQGLQQNAPAGPNGSTSSSSLSDLANRIADRHGLHGAHRHHRAEQPESGPSSTSSTSDILGQGSSDLTTIAGLLQMSPDQLLQQLQGGTSLSDLASQQGVSLDSLANYLQPGLALDQIA